MLQFIFTMLVMFSAGTVLFLVTKTLPQLEEGTPTEKLGVFERFVVSEIPERLDRALEMFLLKFLRKLKVWILKVDNSITHHLKRLKPEATNGVSKVDFKEILSEKAAEASSDLPSEKK